MIRCPGSDHPPHRTAYGRAQCQWCGKRWALKKDGTVRRHRDNSHGNGVDNTDKLG